MDHGVGQRERSWPHPKCQLPLLNGSECQVLSKGPAVCEYSEHEESSLFTPVDSKVCGWLNE